MFTKPSLSELLEGVSKTAENVLLPALAGSPAADAVTALLTVLDRVEAEWPTNARHLAEDNLDIEQTLRRMERAAPAGVAAQAMSAGFRLPSPGATGSEREHHLSAHELAEHNRRLKGALIWAIEALDLPAGSDAPAPVRHADLEVRQLLARMLRREREANPTTPPRLNPLSRGGPALEPEEVKRM